MRSPSTPRKANGLPATRSCSTPTFPWRDATCSADHWRQLRYSPSCFVLHAGSRATYPDDAHHTISFGAAWKGVFDEVLGGRLMSDPSFLVTSPSRTDPQLAPVGRSSYYVLFPTPNLDGPLDWSVEGPRYRERVIDTLESRGWPGFRAGLEVAHATTPLDWAAAGMAAGTPFAAAHTFTQTGPFRPRNLWGDNVVFAGSGTQPGVGVPMVLISGRLAAERILGNGRTPHSSARVITRLRRPNSSERD